MVQFKPAPKSTLALYSQYFKISYPMGVTVHIRSRDILSFKRIRENIIKGSKYKFLYCIYVIKGDVSKIKQL